MKPMKFLTEDEPSREQSLEHNKRQKCSFLRADVESALLPHSWNRADTPKYAPEPGAGSCAITHRETASREDLALMLSMWSASSPVVRACNNAGTLFHSSWRIVCLSGKSVV